MTPPPVSNGHASQTGGGVTDSLRRRYVFFSVNYFIQGIIGIVYEPLNYLLKDSLRLTPGQASGFIAWMTLPLLAAAALTPVSQTHQDATGGNGEELRTFAVACALVSLLAANTLRAAQIGEFMTEHLAQLPRAPDVVPRIEIIDTSNSFYGADLVQNEPHLRGGVVRMISHGATADRKLLEQYYPGYRRVYADHHGEVWSPASDGAGAPAGPSTSRRR